MDCGMDYDITISEYLKDRPIKGIKVLRHIFGWSLYDAKLIFDEIKTVGRLMTLTAEQAVYLELEGFVVGSDKLNSHNINHNVTVYISEEVLDGNAIEAIKRLRYASKFQFGLKEAKDMIAEMWKSERPVVIRRNIEVSDATICRLIEQGLYSGWVY